jgi:hypothetical protein
LKKKTKNEIKESNENDIVAKATSDTIWDWKIQEDDLLNGIKAFSDTKSIRLATVQNGGLIIYIRRHIKMSIKLYSFIEQNNWQDEYRFKC